MSWTDWKEIENRERKIEWYSLRMSGVHFFEFDIKLKNIHHDEMVDILILIIIDVDKKEVGHALCIH